MSDQKSVEYIQSALAAGSSKEDVYTELLGRGLKVDDIEKSFYEAQKEERLEDSHKRTVRIIVIIGAILIGVGIFSFIAANWQEMSRFTKVAVIIVCMLVSYAAGWYLKEKRNLAKTGSALILLGLIIYGAGIFLLAQIFHIRANWPDGFILWMFGAMAVAYALDSFSFLYVAALLGSVAIIGHPFGIFVGPGYNPFLLTSTYLIFAASVSTFIIGWHVRKKIPSEVKDIY